MDQNIKIDALALKRLKVFNEKNHEILFSELHAKGKTTFIFLRHFGCIACRAHVQKIMEQVRSGKLKTPIVFIGNGDSSIIKSFKEDQDVMDAQIYTDPEMALFDACGLNRGLTYLINSSTAKTAFKLMREGHSQGKQQAKNGSHRQMGGVIALSRVGEVLYYYASEFLGDFPLDNDLE